MQLETLKYSVDRTAADLESMRAQSHHLTRDIRDRKYRYINISYFVNTKG